MSSATVGAIQEPFWVALWMRQATGIAAAVEDADDDGGGLVALEGGIDGQCQGAGALPEDPPQQGSEAEASSNWVWQGRARSLPS